MARPTYRKAQKTGKGYWRSVTPSLDNIDQLFRMAERTTSGDRNYRFSIHGKPCQISPTWAERNPGIDKATYSYSLDKDTVFYAIEDAEATIQEEYPDVDDLPFETRAELHRVAFANLVITADENKCWETVDWIDVVDTDDNPPPQVKPLSDAQRRQIAKQLTKKSRKLT